MTCPRCSNEGVVYSALSRELICLVPHCGWERELDEAEVFELLFPEGRRRSVTQSSQSAAERGPSTAWPGGDPCAV